MKSVKLIVYLISILSLLSCTNVAEAPGTALNTEYHSPIVLMYTSTTRFEVLTYGNDGVTILSRDTTKLLIGDLCYSAMKSSRDPVREYRWENDSEGLLISYRQPNSSKDSIGGVIIHGTFTDSDTVLYDSPKLWYPFPADTGVSGEQIGEDSRSIQTMAILNFQLGDSHRFFKTVCYRSGLDSNRTYAYFEINNGLSAQLIYKKGKRFQSYCKI